MMIFRIGQRFVISFILSVCLFTHTVTADLQRIQYNHPDLAVDLGVGLWAWPLPMDYDQDGDYDLIISCSDKPYNGIYFFENVDGNVKFPVFKAPKRLSGASGNIQISYIDGTERILITNQEVLNFRESSISQKNKIYPKSNVQTPPGRVRANQWKYSDYDGDGNLDLIVGVGDWAEYGWDNAYDQNGKWTNGPLRGYVYLLHNNGTTEKPDYAKPEKILAGDSPIDVYGMPSPNLADFDNDGDLDIVCGDFIDSFTYFKNIGTRTQHKYAKGQYLQFNGSKLTMDLCMIIPVALDWDKDGDIDLIVGQEDGRVAFVENTSKLVDGIPQFLPPVFFQQQSADLKYGALVTPFSVDWDNDGDEDLICGNTAGYIGFIENLSTDKGKTPKWAPPVNLKADDQTIRIMAGYNGSIQGPCETKWGYTTLTVADWDGDGLHDIMINSIWGKILWYKNIGTKTAPKLAAAQPVKIDWQDSPQKPKWFWWTPKSNELITQWRTTPFMIDLNKDGMMDLVMLDSEGYLAYFERTRKDDQLILKKPQRIFKKDNMETPLRLNSGIAGRSGRIKLTLVDWDQDGKLDLMVNDKNIIFYKNIATKDGTYVFSNKGLVDKRVLAGHTTSPTIVDWNKDNIPDLLIGAEDGCFYYMNNPTQ